MKNIEHTTLEDTKLLYIVNARIPNERAHGIQIVNTCEGLAKAGVNLTLVTPMFVGEHPTLKDHYGVTESFRHRKIFALDIPHIPFRYFLRNFSFFVSANVYVLIHFLASLFTGKKLVVYVRGEVVLALIPLTYCIPIFFETHQIRNYERWYKVALTRVRGIVVVTDNLKKKFTEEYALDPKKILVARDSVDTDKFANIAKDRNIWSRHGIHKDQKIALYSGTLSAEKGVFTLADAATTISHDVQIVFLGGTEAQVTEFRKKYGHVENISILGRVDYTEVPTYMASADILILPDSANHTYSNLYTSPMKLFEYMASGNPIVASKVPSLLEVINEDSAVFFEAGNPVSLSTTINNSLENLEGIKKLAQAAREIVSEFTWEKRAIAIRSHITDCVET